MGMLNHESKQTKQKLERGTKIEIKNQVDRAQVLDDDTANKTVTIPINIRVDNHIRNQISALLNLGLGKSQKDFVKNVVNHTIEELSESDRARFNKMFDILEEKDQMKYSKNPAPTFDVNMRVDNHTRNAILALARATADKRTASEMVSILIENFLDNMTPQGLEVYQDFLDMLEQKDKLEYKLKNK